MDGRFPGNYKWLAVVPDPESGSVDISIDAPGEYTFTLECADAIGTDTTHVLVTVTNPPPVRIDSFTASSSEIGAGEPVLLSWAVSFARFCVASKGTPGWAALSPDPESGNALIRIVADNVPLCEALAAPH